MSNAPPNFEKQLRTYLDDVKRANSEASKAYLFLEFSRSAFKQPDIDYLEKLFPVLEKYLTTKAKTIVVKGRIDAFLGNLIPEFKKNLDRNAVEEAQSEYVQQRFEAGNPAAKPPIRIHNLPDSHSE
jgi:hypothetical protein